MTDLLERLERDAKSTREIVMDYAGPEAFVNWIGGGPKKLGHNPSWVKVSEVVSLLRDARAPQQEEIQAEIRKVLDAWEKEINDHGTWTSGHSLGAWMATILRSQLQDIQATRPRSSDPSDRDGTASAVPVVQPSRHTCVPGEWKTIRAGEITVASGPACTICGCILAVRDDPPSSDPVGASGRAETASCWNSGIVDVCRCCGAEGYAYYNKAMGLVVPMCDACRDDVERRLRFMPPRSSAPVEPAR